jgi:dipeptide/tripeptide permease
LTSTSSLSKKKQKNYFRSYYSISTNMVIYLRAELGYMPDKAALVVSFWRVNELQDGVLEFEEEEKKTTDKRKPSSSPFFLSTSFFRSPLSVPLPFSFIQSSALIGSSYIAVLGGGMLADGALGRAMTVLVSAVTYVVGLALLTLSALFVEKLRARYGMGYGDRRVSEIEHGVDVVLFYVANVLIALAVGGIKPNVSALGADQFDDFDAKTGAPLEDKNVFFGWYYFFINVGALLAATVLVWVQTSGRWTLGSRSRRRSRRSRRSSTCWGGG